MGPKASADFVGPAPTPSFVAEVRAVTAEDEGYPKRLKRLASPPRVLHLAGSWEHDGPIVA
ncbi:MAG TPA: hypothetical protein VJW75_06850, partial [Candidatus Eisenbacteria bacterium]|nr:hypothetical protein [Candidatus Eisenbacteria bacterium]